MSGDTIVAGKLNGLRAPLVSSTGLLLQWDAPTSGQFDHVVVRRNAAYPHPLTFTDGQGVPVAGGPVTSVVDSGLTPATDYFYTVFLLDPAGTVLESSSLTATTTPLPRGGLAAAESTPSGSWQPMAQQELAALRMTAQAVNDQEQRAAIEEQIMVAQVALDNQAKGPRGMREWWDGTRVEDVWGAIHRARTMLPLALDNLRVLQSYYDALDATAAWLPADDPLRLALRDPKVKDSVTSGRATDLDRNLIHAAFVRTYAASDAEHQRLRSWRNRILVCAVAALVTLVAMVVGMWGMVAGLLPQCQQGQPPAIAGCLTGGTSGHLGSEVLAVAILGCVGAALAAILALRNSQPGASSYSLTPAMSIMRIPLGGITGIIGLILISSTLVPMTGNTAVNSVARIAALAIIFGYAQELVTRLIERPVRAIQESLAARK
jgi:hypothetical protein